jgi:hypothetical protein
MLQPSKRIPCAFTALLALLALLAVLSALTVGCTSNERSRPQRTTIPSIANFGGIQVGYSTQEDLARRWGEGKVITGGHPNSGRVWRILGTGWVMHTDGFEYSSRGLVVDALTVGEDMTLEPEATDARLRAGQLTWMNEISLGMPQPKVIEILTRKGLAPTVSTEDCGVQAFGYYPITGGQMRKWTGVCKFRNGLLSGLTLSASE